MSAQALNAYLTDLLQQPSLSDVCIHASITSGTSGSSGSSGVGTNENCDSDLAIYADFGEGLTLQAPCQKENGRWSHAQDLHLWIIDQLSKSGKSWDAKNPFSDAQIHIGETPVRLHVAFSNTTRSGTLVSLRKLKCRNSKLEYWSTDPAFKILVQAVKEKQTVLIAGATGSGKTTLLSELLNYADPKERILTLEDTPELELNHPHSIGLICKQANSDGFGEISLRRLLRESLRMRPDRVVLGECRGEEVLDLLQCLNTGHRGTLTTVHANSCRDALKRLELLCLLATHGRITTQTIRELFCGGIQWIVHVQRKNHARKITEVVKLDGKDGDSLLLRPVLCQT